MHPTFPPRPAVFFGWHLCRAGAAVSLICPFKQKAICYPVGLTHGPSGAYGPAVERERGAREEAGGGWRRESAEEEKEVEEEEKRREVEADLNLSGGPLRA